MESGGYGTILGGVDGGNILPNLPRPALVGDRDRDRDIDRDRVSCKFRIGVGVWLVVRFEEGDFD